MNAKSNASTPSGIDFKKLGVRSLMNYIGYHNIRDVPLPSSKEVLVAACTKHFQQWQVNEADASRTFSVAVRNGFQSRELPGSFKFRKRILPNPDSCLPDSKSRSYARRKCILRKDERVAAKVTETDENGSWILAIISQYFSYVDKYEVIDGDDTSRKYVVDPSVVRPLFDRSHAVAKGASVLAVFPETTSFYRAKMARMLKRGGVEAFVQFEDDEDESGRTPNRKIPAIFLMILNNKEPEIIEE